MHYSEAELSNPGDSRTMFEVTVLFDGYSRTEEGGRVMRANCTCTLVRGEGITAIVDTRTAWDGQEITEALRRRGVECEDVDFVVCTHGHSDHIGCNYLFKKVGKPKTVSNFLPSVANECRKM